MQKKALVIINQHTAKFKLRADLLEIIDILTKGGYACVARPTQKPGDATRYTASNAAMFDLIVCTGGDGTLNEVVSGLCMLPPEKRPPVGYIPAGTTNDFASSVGLPCDPLTAAKHLIKAEPRAMDCGRIDDHIFNYIASFGAFTEVSYDTPQPMKNLFGHFAYLLESVKHLADIKSFPLRFTFRDETGGEVELAGDYAFGAFVNTLSIGGVIKLSPSEVALDDGFHEYLLIRMPRNVIELNEAAAELGALQNPKRRTDTKHIVSGKFSQGKLLFGVDAMQWSLDGERVCTGAAATVANLHEAYRLML